MESVNDYFVAINKLAEKCNFGQLREEMIRDRIVVGKLDQSLSERLQLDPNLTLKKAIDLAQNAEIVKILQKVLGETEEEGCIEAKVGVITSSTQREAKSFEKCNWCGSKKHEKKSCPARNCDCFVCGKKAVA